MKRLFPSLFTMASIWVSIFSSAASYAQNEKAESEPERITVYGQRSLFTLKKEIKALEISFYDLFNEINDDPRFDIVCGIQETTGSNIPVKGCEPRYMKAARTELTRFNSGGAGLGANVSVREIEARTKRQRKKSLEILQKALKDNPELQARFTKLQQLVAVYDERKNAQKD